MAIDSKDDDEFKLNRRQLGRLTGSALAASGLNPAKAVEALASGGPVTTAALAKAVKHVKAAKSLSASVSGNGIVMQMTINKLTKKDKTSSHDMIQVAAERWKIMLPKAQELSEHMQAMVAHPVLRRVVEQWKQDQLRMHKDILQDCAALARKCPWQMNDQTQEIVRRVEHGKLSDNLAVLTEWVDQLKGGMHEMVESESLPHVKKTLDAIDIRHQVKPKVILPGLDTRGKRLLHVLLRRLDDSASLTLSIPKAENSRKKASITEGLFEGTPASEYSFVDIPDPARLISQLSRGWQEHLTYSLKKAGHHVTPEIKKEIERAFSEKPLIRPEEIDPDPEAARWQLAYDHGFSKEELSHAAKLDAEALSWLVNARDDKRHGR